jgi:hypothetical protein
VLDWPSEGDWFLLGDEARTDLLVRLNEMDATVVDLGAAIQPRVRDDLRYAITVVKDRLRQPGEPSPVIGHFRILRSEADRALVGWPGLRTWYRVGEAVGRYHLAIKKGTYEDPLPDFGVVLSEIRDTLAESRCSLPVLDALVKLAPQLAALGPRPLLGQALEDQKYETCEVYQARWAVLMLMWRLHDTIYRQLEGLPCTDQALNAHGVGVETLGPNEAPPAPLTGLQNRVLAAVAGKGLTLDALAEAVKKDRKQLHRDALRQLMTMGRLRNDRRLGGYYDPTAPPQGK